MARFRSRIGYHLSEDGAQPWAHFTRVRGSAPPIYEFETSDREVVKKLKALDGVEQVDQKDSVEQKVTAYEATPQPVTERKPGAAPKETE
jgi:hypothetical protein